MFPQLQLTPSYEIWAPCTTPVSLLLSCRWPQSNGGSSALVFPNFLEILDVASHAFPLYTSSFLSFSKAAFPPSFLPVLLAFPSKCLRPIPSVLALLLRVSLGAFLSPSTYSFCKMSTTHTQSSDYNPYADGSQIWNSSRGLRSNSEL